MKIFDSNRGHLKWFLIGCFVLISVNWTSIDVLASTQEEQVKRGSSMRALLNRSKLRVYVEKIETGVITPTELRDYIEYGGNIDFKESYDVMKNFFVGSSDELLLNFFVSDSSLSGAQTISPGRLESLSLLLRAGANANAAPDGVVIGFPRELPPVLYAAKMGDHEALELLLNNGGDPNLLCSLSTRFHPGAPPLALSSTHAVSEVLLKYGAKLNYQDENGQTLYHMAINSRNIEKVKWLLSKKVSITVNSARFGTPLEYVREKIKYWNVIIDHFDKKMVERIDLLKSYSAPKGYTHTPAEYEAEKKESLSKIQNDRRKSNDEYAKVIADLKLIEALLLSLDET